MAAAPRWKVYDAKKCYRASCQELLDATVLVQFLGEGATIRNGHRVVDIVWCEGKESMSYAEVRAYVEGSRGLHVR